MAFTSRWRSATRPRAASRARAAARRAPWPRGRKGRASCRERACRGSRASGDVRHRHLMPVNGAVNMPAPFLASGHSKCVRFPSARNRASSAHSAQRHSPGMTIDQSSAARGCSRKHLRSWARQWSTMGGSTPLCLLLPSRPRTASSAAAGDARGKAPDRRRTSGIEASRRVDRDVRHSSRAGRARLYRAAGAPSTPRSASTMSPNGTDRQPRPIGSR